MATPLEASLVEFFKRATVSSATVRKLGGESEPVPRARLVKEVNAMLVHLVPDYEFAGSAADVAESLSYFEATVIKGLTLLAAAGIVAESEAGYSLSEVGRELYGKIQ